MITEVQVGPHRYDVVVDEARVNKESVSLKSRLTGCCNLDEGIISIRPGLSQDQTCDTLLHEVLHAVFLQIGLNGDDREEDLILRLTPPLLDLIRRNPDLCSYLALPGAQPF